MDEEHLEEVKAQLGSIIERLDDLAFDILSQAVSKGEQKRPEMERRVTRARHAIQKALSVLEGISFEDADNT